MPWQRVDQFVGQFSHDIRNGLNSLELQLTFLGEISTDPEAVQEVKRLRGSIADLTRQIQAVRLATGSVQPHPFPYPAGDFIEDLRERFNRQHADAAARVRWQTAIGTVALAIDPELTLAALLELLAKRLPVHHARHADHRAGRRGRRPCDVLPPGATLRAAYPMPTDDWGRTPFLSTRRGGYGLGQVPRAADHRGAGRRTGVPLLRVGRLAAHDRDVPGRRAGNCHALNHPFFRP